MPTYDYSCLNCGKEFFVTHSIKEHVCKKVSCPKCKSRKVERIISSVQIKTTHINRNIYMLEATGDVAGNIGASIGSDGVLLVDTQFAPLADQIRSSLTAIGGEEIRFIINTHCHEDHTHDSEGGPLSTRAW